MDGLRTDLYIGLEIFTGILENVLFLAIIFPTKKEDLNIQYQMPTCKLDIVFSNFSRHLRIPLLNGFKTHAWVV